jgi:hypothetical protein
MIELWDGWAITADEYQFILGKPKKRTDGSDYTDMRDPTYHGNIGNALVTFFNRKLRESVRDNDYTLSQALLHAFRIEEDIRSLITEPDFESALNSLKERGKNNGN